MEINENIAAQALDVVFERVAKQHIVAIQASMRQIVEILQSTNTIYGVAGVPPTFPTISQEICKSSVTWTRIAPDQRQIYRKSPVDPQ